MISSMPSACYRCGHENVSDPTRIRLGRRPISGHPLRLNGYGLGWRCRTVGCNCPKFVHRPATSEVTA